MAKKVGSKKPKKSLRSPSDRMVHPGGYKTK